MVRGARDFADMLEHLEEHRSILLSVSRKEVPDAGAIFQAIDQGQWGLLSHYLERSPELFVRESGPGHRDTESYAMRERLNDAFSWSDLSSSACIFLGEYVGRTGISLGMMRALCANPMAHQWDDALTDILEETHADFATQYDSEALIRTLKIIVKGDSPGIVKYCAGRLIDQVVDQTTIRSYNSGKDLYSAVKGVFLLEDDELAVKIMEALAGITPVDARPRLEGFQFRILSHADLTDAMRVATELLGYQASDHDSPNRHQGAVSRMNEGGAETDREDCELTLDEQCCQDIREGTFPLTPEILTHVIAQEFFLTLQLLEERNVLVEPAQMDMLLDGVLRNGNFDDVVRQQIVAGYVPCSPQQLDAIASIDPYLVMHITQSLEKRGVIAGSVLATPVPLTLC